MCGRGVRCLKLQNLLRAEFFTVPITGRRGPSLRQEKGRNHSSMYIPCFPRKQLHSLLGCQTRANFQALVYSSVPSPRCQIYASNTWCLPYKHLKLKSMRFIPLSTNLPFLHCFLLQWMAPPSPSFQGKWLDSPGPSFPLTSLPPKQFSSYPHYPQYLHLVNTYGPICAKYYCSH